MPVSRRKPSAEQLDEITALQNEVERKTSGEDAPVVEGVNRKKGKTNIVNKDYYTPTTVYLENEAKEILDQFAFGLRKNDPKVDMSDVLSFAIYRLQSEYGDKIPAADVLDSLKT